MPVPVVTVVTPSYNQGCFIRATIESVLSQNYPYLEYIVMDGGSTDETAAVVKEYSSRLTFISERDRGQSHAINKGFQMARGSVLAWLNSDDLYLPGSIHAAVDAFDRNPSAGAVYGEGYLIDSAGKSASRFPWTQTFDLWRLTYLSDYILQQTVFFRRAALDEVGYLNECLHYTMDWDILIRLGKRYPVEYIPAYMACLREHPEAKTFAGGKSGDRRNVSGSPRGFLHGVILEKTMRKSIAILFFLLPLAAQNFDPKFYAGLRWRSIGPYRGGRTVGAAGVPQQPNVFYIGVNNGGVWKTDDAGRTWFPVFDDQPTGSIGDVAVAPSDPNTVYAGSGEGLQRPDLSVGDGMYRSTDAGKTWRHLGLRDGQQIARILVDPRDPRRLFVAVLGHPYGPNAERGVYRSTDGGDRFDRVLYKDENTGAVDLAFDPRNPAIV